MPKTGEKQKIKLRIQKLLLQYVRQRDKSCVMGRFTDTGKCGGVTSADHIITRTINSTFADPDNVVLLCWYHHFQWKPSNPTLYADRIREVIGTRKYNRIHKLAKETHERSKKDWLAVEEEWKKKKDPR